MRDNIENSLDKLSEKIITASNLETPSLDFTATIMSNINVVTKQSESTIYKPLISKKAWLFIAVVFILLLSYILSVNTSGNISWFTDVNFSFMPNISMTNLFSKLSFSKTVVYAIVFLTLMLFVQVSLLKKHYDNQINFE